MFFDGTFNITRLKASIVFYLRATQPGLDHRAHSAGGSPTALKAELLPQWRESKSTSFIDHHSSFLCPTVKDFLEHLIQSFLPTTSPQQIWLVRSNFVKLNFCPQGLQSQVPSLHFQIMDHEKALYLYLFHAFITFHQQWLFPITVL